MHHHDRRILAAGVGIAQFDPSPIHHGRRMTRHRILEDTGEARRTQGSGCRVMGRMNRTIQLADARAMQGGDKMNVRVVNELQSPT